MSIRTSDVVMSPSQYSSLLSEFYRREMSAKYRGTLFGFAWMFITPLLMFAAYAIAFSGIIGVHRMSAEYSDAMDYLVNLYLGLSAFFLMSDVMGSSIGLISSRPGYVRKVVFPLSVLVVTRVLVALTSYLVNVAMIIVFLVLIGRSPGWTVTLMPFVVVLVTLQMLGIASLLASIGVFLRDIEQVVGPLSRLLLFVTPIAYPLSMVPESYRQLFLLNPLTSIVTSTKDLAIHGTLPDLASIIALGAFSLALPVLGALVYVRLRPGFADVV